MKIDVKPAVTLRELVAKSKLNVFRKHWLADYPDAENYLSKIDNIDFKYNPSTTIKETTFGLQSVK